MKLGLWFTINAVIAVLFGLGFILMPAQLLSLYAVELPVQGIFVAQLYGCALLGFGIITGMLRNATPSSGEVRAVLLGLLVSELLGFAFSLWYQLQGMANSLGWLTVVLYLVLGLGFAYFYFKKPAA